MIRFITHVFAAVGILFFLPLTLQAEPVHDIKQDEKCRVCGMFVAKYQPWIAQLHYTSGDVAMFDGVKDMMAYFFEPEKYGATTGDTVSAIYVKDYYTQEWLDGKEAVYVIGSDVMGPMGHEFIPFNASPAAENFVKDHKGKSILEFEEITPEQVSAMRGGMKMKGKKMDTNHDMDGHSMKKD